MKQLKATVEPPLYIFDLDGTVCNVDHRRHLVMNGREEFEKFNRECVRDVPHDPVVKTLKLHRAAGAHIWLWSGRDDYVQAETMNWLEEFDVPHDQLRMRISGDRTEDAEMKEGWLNEMSPTDRARLVAVYDDRDSVVAMWRRNGVKCFQVAPGDF